MGEKSGYNYKNEPSGCVIECSINNPNLNKSSITFYYGKSSYLAIANSSRNDGSFDTQWYINDGPWFKSATPTVRM